MPKNMGGTDGMHMKPDKHPFQSKFKSTLKFAKTVGVNAPPGGEGDKISANSAMKGKRSLNGSGKA